VLLVLSWPVRADESFFERSIRPILAGTCFRCHGGERTGGKLRVDSREALLKGGESGPALVPGDPARSLLLRALRHADDVPHMPPGKTLSPEAINDFTRWVRDGAPWPTRPSGFAHLKHWAFDPPRKVDPPSANGATPIDNFLIAQLRRQGLAPNGRADARTLIRRLTFDLIGLPPTPDEVEAFVTDPRPDAYERLVDRLLASPAYGEKWGRHWLDVVRYADTAGETADFPVPDAWRYRNHVIDALNEDQPYNQFIREQIAGDLLARDLPADVSRRERVGMTVATGYLAMARRFGFDSEKDHYLTLEDTIDVLGKSLLGLTVGCARCHDHKYDPISQKDYYALYGILDSTRYPFAGCEKVNRPRDLVALPPLPTGPVPRPVERAYAVAEGKPHNARIHQRGDPTTPGEEVPRRFLTILGGQVVSPGEGSGRLSLSAWLTDPKNPLTARVMVNRVWLHHFGRGLVDTPNDFGSRGSPPSHPELLDWLAVTFMEDGWSLKKLHRRLVCSEAYRRSSADNSSNSRLDPDNRYLWKHSRRRLQAEEIRDALLAVSGELDRTPAGPHPFPPETSWGFTQHNPFQAVYDHSRRSVYLMTQRIKRHPFLALFDGADPSSSTGQRYTTTVPTQALYFLNDPFVHARSSALAGRLLPLSEGARLDRACRLLYGRPPEEREQELARRFLADYAAQAGGSPAEKEQRAWAAWLRVMLAGNEFIHVD
jgi:hypothetical protein